MGKHLVDGFVCHFNVPIDSRFEAATSDEMLNYEDRDSYEGLLKINSDDNNLYMYTATYTSTITGHFKRVGLTIDKKTIIFNDSDEIETAVGGKGGKFVLLGSGSHETVTEGDKKTVTLDWNPPENFKFPDPSMGAVDIKKASLDFSFQWSSAWISESADYDYINQNTISGPISDCPPLVKWEVVMDWDAGTGVLNLYKDPSSSWGTSGNVYGGAELNLVFSQINSAKFVPIDEKTIIYDEDYKGADSDPLKTSIDGVIKNVEPKVPGEKAISSSNNYYLYSYPYKSNELVGSTNIHLAKFPTISAHNGSETGDVVTTWEPFNANGLELNWVPQYSGDTLIAWTVKGEWEATTDPQNFPKLLDITVNAANGHDITLHFDNPPGSSYFIGFEIPTLIGAKPWITESAPIDNKTIAITAEDRVLKASNIRITDSLGLEEKVTEVIFRLPEDFVNEEGVTYRAGLYMYELVDEDTGEWDWVPVGGLPIDEKTILMNEDGKIETATGGCEIHSFKGNILSDSVHYSPINGTATIPFEWEDVWEDIKEYFSAPDEYIQGEVGFDALIKFTYTDDDGVDKEIDSTWRVSHGVRREPMPHWESFNCYSEMEALNKVNSELRVKIPVQNLKFIAQDTPYVQLTMSNFDAIKEVAANGSIIITIALPMHNAIHVPVDYETITTEDGKLRAEVIRTVHDFYEVSLTPGVVYRLNEETTFKDVDYRPGLYIYNKALDELEPFISSVNVDDFTIVENPENENKIETVIGGGWKDVELTQPLDIFTQDAGDHLLEIIVNDPDVKINKNTKIQVEIKTKITGEILKWEEPFFVPRATLMEEVPEIPWDPTWIEPITDADQVFYTKMYYHHEGEIQPTSFSEVEVITCESERRIVLFTYSNWHNLFESYDDIKVTLVQQYDIDGTFVPIDYKTIGFDKENEVLRAINTKTQMTTLEDCERDNIYYLSEDYYPNPVYSPDAHYVPGLYTKNKDFPQFSSNEWAPVQPVVDDRTVYVKDTLSGIDEHHQITRNYLAAKNVKTEVEDLTELKYEDVTHKLKQEWTDDEGKVYAKGGIYAYDETNKKIVPYIAPDEISMSFDEDGYITAINTKTLLTTLEGCKENNIYHLAEPWTAPDGTVYKKGLYTWDKTNNVWVRVASVSSKTFTNSLDGCEVDMIYHLITEYTHPDTGKVYKPGVYSYNETSSDWERLVGINGNEIIGDSTSTSLEVVVNLTQAEYDTLVADGKMNPEALYVITDSDSPTYPDPASGHAGDVLVKTVDGTKWKTPVNTISQLSTESEIPTAKAVYDLIGDIKTALDRINYGG